MNKTLLTLAGILCCLNSFAILPIDSFYKQGASWVNIYHWRYTSPTPPHTATDYVEGFKMQVGEDTIVNSVTYKKIYSTNIGLFESTASAQYRSTGKVTKYNEPPMYIGRIRISGRKIYFTDEGESKAIFLGAENIMYDFSGNTGDSVDCLIYPYKMKITKTDTILLNTGDTVKRYYYNGHANFDAIEGLGSRGGTLADLRTIVGFKPGVTDITTLCYSSGNISYNFPVDHTLYDWHLASTCFNLDVLGIEEKQTTETLTLYPNPSNGSFTITGNVTGKELKIVVFNTLGQAVYSGTLQVTGNAVKRELALTDLPKGIYRMVVSSADKQQVLPLVIE